MRVLQLELFKIFNRRRSYIGFIAVIALVILVMAAFYYEGDELFNFVAQNLGEKRSFFRAMWSMAI